MVNDEVDPNLTPGWQRRVLFFSIAFIIFGIIIIPMSLTAYRSGHPIPMLTKTRPIYGWEGFPISFLSEVIGIGGIWAVRRNG